MEQVDSFVLACLEDMAWEQGKPCADGGRCWCGWPNVKPRDAAYHSAVCYELRKHFKEKIIQEPEQGD